MAGVLTRCPPQAASALLALLALCTLPAAALGPQAPFTPAPERATAADFAPGAAGAAALAAPGLAGVRLGRTPLALIDGQWWPTGASPRAGQRLHAIDAHGVVLRHADGRSERLSLHPPLPPAAAPAPAPRPTPDRQP
jgi:hypothetical protein